MKLIVICGLPIWVGTLEESGKTILDHIKEKKSYVVLPTSLNDIASFISSKDVAHQYSLVDMLAPDGMPIVWYAQRKLGKKIDRVYGPDLMKYVLEHSSGSRHAFFGASHESLIGLKKGLARLVPGLSAIAMVSPSYRFSTKEENEHLHYLKDLKPSVLWIGLSSPLQVELAARWKKKFPKTVIICVGAAFDFFGGTKSQAPFWMRKSGLEWLFRLLKEPRRLGRRYIVDIPFAFGIYALKYLFRP